jgi:L-galactose dehydrogenase
MEYKILGKTGLKVSIISFGASPLGNEFESIDSSEGDRAVHCAIDHGINYFDVSPYYGRTLAETRLGVALAGKRNDIYLATKVGRYDSDLETGFDFSAERVRASIDESLQRLQTDYLDVIQIHDLEFGDKEQIVNETLPELKRIRESGKVRFVGITGYPVHILRDIASENEVDTILSYCRYNLMDTSMDDVLTPVAKEKQIGLINASILHMRILTDRGAPDWHPAPEKVKKAGEQVAALCAERGVDVASLALQYVLQHEYVATTLIGMSKVRHVEANLKDVGIVPDAELLADVKALIAPVANVYWKSGRPENDDPGAIDQKV